MLAVFTLGCGGGGTGYAPAQQSYPQQQAQPQATSTPFQQSGSSINNANYGGVPQNGGKNGGYVPRARQNPQQAPSGGGASGGGGYTPSARQNPPPPVAPSKPSSGGGYVPRKK